jgi:serum/glucocorticoid-regulated kinase 2
MYNKILHGSLVLSDKLMSPEAQDIITKLLERDPKKRLGSGLKEADEVKAHPWFAGVNWDDVYYKRITPPFLPDVKSDTDTSCFDDEFTRQAPIDSVVESSYLAESVQKEFEGFTYSDNGIHLQTDDDVVM